jgi:acetyl esterase/lipase
MGCDTAATQVSDATTQTPTVEPSATPVPPTPPPTTTPAPFANALAYSLPGMEEAEVRTVEYRRVDGKPYFMDIYYPPQSAPDQRLPVVIFVLGLPNEMVVEINGKSAREFLPLRSWARLVAAAGMICVAYDTDRPDDLEHVVQIIRQNGGALKMDAERIGLYTESVNSPTAISYAMRDEHDFLNFAVFYSGIMLAPDNTTLTEIANEACRGMGCYVPNPDDGAAGLPEVEQIRTDLPMLLTRLGRDFPHVNLSVDQFIEQATAAGAKLTVLDHPEGLHNFHVMQKRNERTKEIIAQTLEFMSDNFGQP